MAAQRNQLVHVFVDNSNVYLGAQRGLDPVTGAATGDAASRDFRTRVNVARLVDVVEQGRRVAGVPGARVAVGSHPGGSAGRPAWAKAFAKAGYEVLVEALMQDQGQDLRAGDRVRVRKAAAAGGGCPIATGRAVGRWLWKTA